MAGQPTRLRLPRALRVRERREFAALRTQGLRLAHGCLIANWKPAASGSPSRIGVITSRKIGSAVVRNRARRLIREAFRLHRHDLTQPVVVVFVARASIVGRPLAHVERDVLHWMRRARLLTGS